MTSYSQGRRRIRGGGEGGGWGSWFPSELAAEKDVTPGGARDVTGALDLQAEDGVVYFDGGRTFAGGHSGSRLQSRLQSQPRE